MMTPRATIDDPLAADPGGSAAPNGAPNSRDDGLSRRGFVVGTAVAAGAATVLAKPAMKAFGDPFTDDDHGSGTATEPYGPEDVIYSMCMQCNTFCTIKVRLADAAAGAGATSLIRKLAGNPYSPLTTQPMGPIPYDTPVSEAVSGIGVMARDSFSRSGGRICLKGQAGLQVAHDARRITSPLKRVGPRGSGKWKSISWEQALNEILDGAADIGTPGLREWYAWAPEAQVMGDWEQVNSGALSKKEFHARWADKLIDPDQPEIGTKANLLTIMGGDRMSLIGDRWSLQGFGTVNAFNHGGICGMSGVVANARSHPTTNHKRMYADLDHVRYLIVWGTEPLTANKGPTWLAPRISNGLQRGMKLIVIDPRMSKTAEKAHRWVPVRPGGDAALAFAMARLIIERKRYDERYLRAPGAAAAAAIGEPTWSDATHLVKVDDPKRGKLTLADFGEADEAKGETRLVLVGGTLTPATTASLADLDVDTTVTTPAGPVRVRSVFALLRERITERTVEDCADEAGVPVEVIEELATDFTSYGKQAAVMSYRGPAMHTNGYDTVRAIGYLNFLIGNHDWKGGHIAADAKFAPLKGRYDLTTIPNARQAWGIPVTREKTVYEQTGFFKRDGYPAKRRWYPLPGNLGHEVLPSAKARYPYPLKALLIHRHSLIDSNPGGHRQAELLSNPEVVELVVAFDVTVGDTAAYADYVLPDLTYLERFTQESIYPTQPYRVTQLGQPTTRAMKGPRAVEDFYIDLMKGLGLPGVGPNAFPNGESLDTVEDYWLKMAANVAYAGKQPVPDADAEEMRIFTEARRKALGDAFDEARWKAAVTPEEWPKVVYVLNRGGRFEGPGNEYEGDWITYRYDGECAFYDPKTAATKDSISGKPFDGIAVVRAATYADGTPLNADRPLQMINWKSRQQGTHRTANSAWLREVRPENHLWINTRDADQRGIKNGDRVRITSAGGKVEATARVLQGIRPGVVGADFSYGHRGYGATEIEIDGKKISPVERYGHTHRKIVPGKEETGYAEGRGTGFSVNSLLEDDVLQGGGGLTDPIGGGAAQLDLWVEVERI